MPVEYEIKERFEITGRGVAIPIDEMTERSVRTPYKVQVITPTSNMLDAEAYKEYLLLRTTPTVLEKECYLLKGLRKGDVPIGSRLRFVD